MSLAGDLLEPDRVDLMSVALERVPVSARADDARGRAGRPVGLEGVTESRNVGAERLHRGPRRVFAPELLDEVIDGHDTTPPAIRQARMMRSFDPAIGSGSPSFLATSRGPRTRKRMAGGYRRRPKRASPLVRVTPSYGAASGWASVVKWRCISSRQLVSAGGAAGVSSQTFLMSFGQPLCAITLPA